MLIISSGFLPNHSRQALLDQDYVGGVFPRLHQGGACATFLAHDDIWQFHFAQPTDNSEPDTIVAAKFIAEADDERLRGAVHSRMNLSFRKWVAQEMQGS